MVQSSAVLNSPGHPPPTPHPTHLVGGQALLAGEGQVEPALDRGDVEGPRPQRQHGVQPRPRPQVQHPAVLVFGFAGLQGASTASTGVLRQQRNGSRMLMICSFPQLSSLVAPHSRERGAPFSRLHRLLDGRLPTLVEVGVLQLAQVALGHTDVGLPPGRWEGRGR